MRSPTTCAPARRPSSRPTTSSISPTRSSATPRRSLARANQRLTTGYWYGKARHRQTAPAVRVDNDGNSADLWLANDALWLRHSDGSPYQNRDQLTISKAGNFFLTDTMGFMQEKLRI